MKTPNRPGTPGSALRGSMLSGPMSGRKRSRDCRTLFQDDDTSDPIQVRVWGGPVLTDARRMYPVHWVVSPCSYSVTPQSPPAADCGLAPRRRQRGTR